MRVVKLPPITFDEIMTIIRRIADLDSRGNNDDTRGISNTEAATNQHEADSDQGAASGREVDRRNAAD
jgi:hypothetical protein